MLLCTQPFASVAAGAAKSSGVPDLARLSVPHDLLALDDHERRDLAERLVADALGALTSAR